MQMLTSLDAKCISLPSCYICTSRSYCVILPNNRKLLFHEAPRDIEFGISKVFKMTFIVKSLFWWKNHLIIVSHTTGFLNVI